VRERAKKANGAERKRPQLGGVKVAGCFVGGEEVVLVDEDGGSVEMCFAFLDLLLEPRLRGGRVFELKKELLSHEELL